jgi:5S rRNA maturation endonuclease (ribonuclease M5)
MATSRRTTSFRPTRRKYVTALKAALKDASEVILATDPDREGESISWHLQQILKPKVKVRRIVFHEITEEAVRHALSEAHEDVDENLVRAQESRRILDRLYGYTLSPVLWKKVQTGLSAGRVQSVAVRLIVEREEERWRSARQLLGSRARLRADGREFGATLVKVGDERVATGKDFDSGTLTSKHGTRARPHLGGRDPRCEGLACTCRGPSPRLTPSRSPSGRRRRSPPPRCSRRPTASSASRPNAPCRWRSGCSRAWTSAAATSKV